jgi:hypothetical protein
MTTTANDAIQWESRYVGGSRFADGSAIIRPEEMAWTNGPLDGIRFRLTHIDRSSGMWTAIFKVEPNVSTPPHFNHGEVQIYALEGNLAVGQVSLGAGDYFQDAGGLVREIVAGPNGATFFVMYTAGLSAVGADGKPSGPFIDANRIYELAAANSAAHHLPAPPAN